MTNGPIERYSSHLELNKSKREKALGDVVGKRGKKVKKKKNPYPEGSARAAQWARRERAKQR